ncbi:MAG TPA: hypothetical protein VJ998_10080 [Pseudomonadales bacterium]|nr:hypothetical protein [Pseudomonadales bacterium]
MNELGFLWLTAVGLYLLVIAVGLAWCQFNAPKAMEIVVGNSLAMAVIAIVFGPIVFLVIYQVNIWLITREDEHERNSI